MLAQVLERLAEESGEGTVLLDDLLEACVSLGIYLVCAYGYCCSAKVRRR